MEELAEREAVAERLEAEIAQACGVLNAAAGRLVGLLAQVLDTEVWQVAGIHSPSQWVAWHCGMSSARARSLLGLAGRVGELPATVAALGAGALSEDQAGLIARRAPARIDAEVAALGQHTCVSQLRRVLGKYSFGTEPKREPEPVPEPVPEEPRRVSFGYDDSGSFRLSALLPADEGAVVEAALAAARDELFRAGEHDAGPHPASADVSWADALVSMAAKSLGATASAHRDRHVVVLHLGTDDAGHLHLGPGLSEGLRRLLSCDARVRAVFEQGGRPVSVGRAWRTVPDRTRMVIEERDGGCRVPGCDRSRWLHIHHLQHWEDGGTTDTANLVALCQHHHRLHHRGGLGITGDADDPDGMVFTDGHGRALAACGRPTPPGDTPLPPGNWVHPTGEHLDPKWVYFDEQLASA